MAHSILTEIEPLTHALRLVEAFHAFDSDNDGSINVQELNGIMGSLGYNLSEQDIDDMMQKGDTNKDGLLSISEFLDLNVQNLAFGDFAGALKSGLQELNLKGDDLVSGEELCEVIENVGIELSLDDCEDIVASIGGDGNGTISFQDLELIVNALV
ncbi:probable calcium-binding protein CML29 [Henckelia pumila]|uniref:probable calcium-binding protein CML29 n=1 Tax=Henckelia pumila TaxID=405737 RepID=UPI003C6E11CA